MTKNAYTDPRPGYKPALVLEALMTRGLTAPQAMIEFDLKSDTRFGNILAVLEDMFGYDIRSFRRGMAPHTTYFVAGRHNWAHDKYETNVSAEGLLSAVGLLFTSPEAYCSPVVLGTE